MIQVLVPMEKFALTLPVVMNAKQVSLCGTSHNN